jgi:hypothetical protein
MDLFRGLAVHFALGHSDSMKDRNGLLLHPVTQAAARQQITDLTEVAPVMMLIVAMVMRVFTMVMLVLVFMVAMPMLMPMFVVMMRVLVMVVMMFMPMLVSVIIIVVVILHLHIEFDAFNAGFLRPTAMQMKPFELEGLQVALEIPEFDTEVEQRAKEHVPADPAEGIQVKCSHSNSPAANALIWLAA